MADNENYYYNTTTGVVVPDTSKIKEEVEQEYKNALGQDLDTSASTPQGRLIEVETTARKRTIENNALLANMFNPNQSYGIFLDSIASLFGVDRVGATRTRVNCQLSGVANTIIPANAQAMDTEGNIYYLENQATIGSGGTTNADFLCMEKGAIECPIGTLTEIVTAVIGWNAITNEVAGEIGLDGESDNELRKNLPTKQYKGVGIREAIKNRILEVEDVKSCIVIDNPSNSNDTTSVVGKTLSPHSLYVCVDGGKDEKIARAILDKSTVGCAFAGTDKTITVETDDNEYDVSFDVATDVRIYVKVTVDVGSSVITESAIKSAIKSYANNEVKEVDGLKLGVNVNAFEIASAISIQIPDLSIVSVQVSDDNTNWLTNIDIAKYEKGTIAEADITVIQQ